VETLRVVVVVVAMEEFLRVRREVIKESFARSTRESFARSARSRRSSSERSSSRVECSERSSERR